MKENLVLANYKVESEAYQALSELKRETTNANYTISQAVIVKKENGKLSVMDGFVNGATTGDDTMTGGLIGSLVGILGGPLGILLGGSMGMLIGGAVDAGDMADNASLLEKAGDSILDGETAIILLAQEEYETALTAKLNNFEVTITRFDAAEVAAEVEHAREVEKQMAKEAREKMREERSEAFKESVAKKSEELKNWFSHLATTLPVFQSTTLKRRRNCFPRPVIPMVSPLRSGSMTISPVLRCAKQFRLCCSTSVCSAA